MEEIKELKLTVPWGQVAAIAKGSVKNFPVLLVHGTLDNASVFSRMIKLLPSKYYYVSIDLPGHGKSSHFPIGTPLDFFNYLLTIRYVLRELNWKSFYYIGHSLGGQLGIFFSILYPDQIQKLIIIDAGIPYPISNENLIDRIRFLQDEEFSMSEKSNAKLYSKDDIIHSLKNRRNFCLTTDAAEAIFDRSVIKVGEQYKYSRDFRLKNFVRPLMNLEQILVFYTKLSTNTLIIMASASADSSFGPLLDKLFKAAFSLPNLKIVMVKGNHDVHNNYPERVVAHIKLFLNDELSSKL